MAPQWALLLVLVTLLAALETEQHAPNDRGYSWYPGKGWLLSPGKGRSHCSLAVRLLHILTMSSTRKGQRCYSQQEPRYMGISWGRAAVSCVVLSLGDHINAFPCAMPLCAVTSPKGCS